jgi:hypothetical protein
MGKGKDLMTQLNDVLQDYSKEVMDTYNTCGKEIADDTVSKLKRVKFGRYDRGKYSKSWAVKQEKSNWGSNTYIVYNKKHYRLTHLLEFGHVVKNGTKRVVGKAGAIPHIKPMEEWVQQQLPKLLVQKLGGR